MKKFNVGIIAVGIMGLSISAMASSSFIPQTTSLQMMTNSNSLTTNIQLSKNFIKTGDEDNDVGSNQDATGSHDQDANGSDDQDATGSHDQDATGDQNANDNHDQDATGDQDTNGNHDQDDNGDQDQD